jgi:hypothetical protein
MVESCFPPTPACWLLRQRLLALLLLLLLLGDAGVEQLLTHALLLPLLLQDGTHGEQATSLRSSSSRHMRAETRTRRSSSSSSSSARGSTWCSEGASSSTGCKRSGHWRAMLRVLYRWQHFIRT